MNEIPSFSKNYSKSQKTQKWRQKKAHNDECRRLQMERVLKSETCYHINAAGK